MVFLNSFPTTSHAKPACIVLVGENKTIDKLHIKHMMRGIVEGFYFRKRATENAKLRSDLKHRVSTSFSVFFASTRSLID